MFDVQSLSEKSLTLSGDTVCELVKSFVSQRQTFFTSALSLYARRSLASDSPTTAHQTDSGLQSGLDVPGESISRVRLPCQKRRSIFGRSGPSVLLLSAIRPQSPNNGLPSPPSERAYRVQSLGFPGPPNL